MEYYQRSMHFLDFYGKKKRKIRDQKKSMNGYRNLIIIKRNEKSF